MCFYLHQLLRQGDDGESSGESRDKLGIAVAQRTYKAYRRLLDSERWLRLANAGARPQRLLWASTGTKDPVASDVLYIRALAAPFTVNTILDKTHSTWSPRLNVFDIGSAMIQDESDVKIYGRINICSIF